MNVINRDMFEINVQTSNLRAREPKKRRRHLKLLGMTNPNRKRRRTTKKLPIIT